MSYLPSNHLSFSWGCLNQKVTAYHSGQRGVSCPAVVHRAWNTPAGMVAACARDKNEWADFMPGPRLWFRWRGLEEVGKQADLTPSSCLAPFPCTKGASWSPPCLAIAHVAAWEEQSTGCRPDRYTWTGSWDHFLPCSGCCSSESTMSMSRGLKSVKDTVLRGPYADFFRLDSGNLNICWHSCNFAIPASIDLSRVL